MKALTLQHENHRRLEAAFKEWLLLTGYAASSVYGIPLYIRELLHWLETQNKTLRELTAPDLSHYFTYLRERKNQRRGGAVSLNNLHKHLNAVRLFSRYLKVTEQAGFEVDITLPDQQRHLPALLSREETGRLYQACEGSPIGLRDRAMLAVFYGCGLRRSEGVGLDVTDYLPENNLLYVRQGKNYRERYVPLSRGVKSDIENYLHYGRAWQAKASTEPAFFLSEHGKRIQGQSLYLRLKKLFEKAEIPKDAGLHILRHSIATHLLQNGMSLSQIGGFLGHSTLDSTQIYTHIVNDYDL